MATLQNCDGVLNNLSRNADRPAVFTLRKRGSETWSYADLDGCVDRLARGLRHAGVARGDRAAIIADNGPEWIAAALAVIRAGGVVVPLDVQLGEKALRHVFGDSTPRFVFTTKNRAERIGACAENARIVLLDATDQDERSWRRLLLKNAGALPKLGPEDHATLSSALLWDSGTAPIGGTGPWRNCEKTPGVKHRATPALRSARRQNPASTPSPTARVSAAPAGLRWCGARSGTGDET